MIGKAKIFIVTVALCQTVQISPASAQPRALDTEEVVARCTEALGGKRSWNAIDSFEIAGAQTSFSKQRPFLLRKMRPNLYRLDLSEGIRSMTVAYDGENGWWQREVLVASRGNWELPTPEVYSRTFAADAEFEMPCLNYQEEGYAIDFLGLGDLDGEPFLRLEASLSNGSVESWYLDSESFLPAARVSTGAYWRLPMEQRMFFSDYREVAGVYLPYRIEVETGNMYRTMDVERVDVNAELDPEIFSLPLPNGMAAIQALAGRWNVEIRSRENGATPWMPSTAVSTITRHSGGSLLEEKISYAAAIAFPLSLRRFVSYDRFQDVFRIAVFDNFTSHLNVLEGTFEDERLILSNLSTNTPWSVYGNTFHTRETLYDISEDSFKVKKETSTDAGSTWFVEEELSYSRAEGD